MSVLSRGLIKSSDKATPPCPFIFCANMCEVILRKDLRLVLIIYRLENMISTIRVFITTELLLLIVIYFPVINKIRFKVF